VTYHVVFTPRARAEAIEAFRWIAGRSPSAAARWLTGLEKAVAKLGKLPERCPVAEAESEQRGITLRLLLYGSRRAKYLVLFSIEGDRVYLHSVRHAAQGPIEG
jgi:plasmid stabilization system protein ParE